MAAKYNSTAKHVLRKNFNEYVQKMLFEEKARF